MLAHGIDDEDLVVSMTHLAGRIDEVSSIRMPERRPVHVAIVGDLVFSRDSDDVSCFVEEKVVEGRVACDALYKQRKPALPAASHAHIGSTSGPGAALTLILLTTCLNSV